MIEEIYIFVISYLIGSINFSWVVGKFLKADISKSGDENLGSMNLYYTLEKNYNKKKAFIFALVGGILDVLKAYIPTVLFGPIAGAFAVIGHCFSIFSIILTKKIPTGIGAASSFGWLLGSGMENVIAIISILIPLLVIGIILFYDIIEIENLNIYTVFLFLATALLYIYIYNPSEILKFSITLISIVVSLSASMRAKVVFKKLIKDKSPGGGI